MPLVTETIWSVKVKIFLVEKDNFYPERITSSDETSSPFFPCILVLQSKSRCFLHIAVLEVRSFMKDLLNPSRCDG